MDPDLAATVRAGYTFTPRTSTRAASSSDGTPDRPRSSAFRCR